MWFARRRICACDGCGGHLEPGTRVLEGLICRSCCCMWRIEDAPRLHRHMGRRAQWYPRPGVCSAANRWLAEWSAEVDREAARRRRSQLGD